MLQTARSVWREVQEDEILERAAALSYYFLFALFPALLFLTALLGLLPWRLMDVLMELLDRALPTDVVHQTFGEIARGASRGLLSVGIAVALVERHQRHDGHHRRPQRGLRRGRRAPLVASTTSRDRADAPAGRCSSSPGCCCSIFGHELGRAVAGRLGLGSLFEVSWALMRWALSVSFLVLGVTFVYHFAPARRSAWRWLTPGSAFAVVAWVAMSLGLRVYATTWATYNATYGSIAGVILLMLWLYLSAVVLLGGRRARRRAPRSRGPIERTARPGIGLAPPTPGVQYGRKARRGDGA